MSDKVQSVDRVFDIIDALSAFPRGLALSDLAEQVGLHVSTTYRLLGMLVSRGYAAKDVESGKYRLTLRMFEIGSRIAASTNLVSAARPFLEYLADLTGETIHLVLRDRDEIVYMYKDSRPEMEGRTASFVGLRAPMYCTGVGKAILAALPENEVREIWSRTHIIKFTPQTITTYAALRRELELDNEEHEKGVRCVASVITDYDRRPVAAMSISAPADSMSEERIIDLSAHIRGATARISALLGS